MNKKLDTFDIIAFYNSDKEEQEEAEEEEDTGGTVILTMETTR